METNKYQLLKKIHTQRRLLEKEIYALNDEELTRPGIVGVWSVKDILAHLSAWEQLFIRWYQAGLEGASPSVLPVGMNRTAIDALNRQIFEQNRNRPLESVMDEFHRSFQQIMGVIEAIPEVELVSHSYFRWTGRFMLADYVSGNTCNHYAWARSKIRKWKQTKTSENSGSHG
jgi:hypothetical protein